MKEQIEKFLSFLRLNNPNVVFTAFLIVFFLDSVVNYYIDFPVFVVFTLAALPVMWLTLWVSNYKSVFLVVFIALFSITVLINNLVYGFGKKNISDLLFILLFATSYFFYHHFQWRLSSLTIVVFLVIATMMISFSMGEKQYLRKKQKKASIEKVEKLPPPTITFNKKNKLNRIDGRRKVIQGLYRVPHVAAYFFGFLALFYGFLYSKHKKWYYLAISLLTAFFVFYSGIRSIVFAILLGFFLFLFLQRKIVVALVSAGLVSLVIVLRQNLFFLLKKTMFKPYLALLVTIFDNPDRQSRLLLWKSWLHEIKEFSWYNFLAGKSFEASILDNKRNIGYREWFHNDFFSIAYSYGFLCLVIYLLLWVIMYRHYSTFIRRNVFIFAFYFAALFSAFFNGFYYYFPVILLFLFFVMINEEKHNPVKQ